jgi:hypothetical protein
MILLNELNLLLESRIVHINLNSLRLVEDIVILILKKNYFLCIEFQVYNQFFLKK